MSHITNENTGPAAASGKQRQIEPHMLDLLLEHQGVQKILAELVENARIKEEKARAKEARRAAKLEKLALAQKAVKEMEELEQKLALAQENAKKAAEELEQKRKEAAQMRKEADLIKKHAEQVLAEPSQIDAPEDAPPATTVHESSSDEASSSSSSSPKKTVKKAKKNAEKTNKRKERSSPSSTSSTSSAPKKPKHYYRQVETHYARALRIGIGSESFFEALKNGAFGTAIGNVFKLDSILKMIDNPTTEKQKEFMKNLRFGHRHTKHQRFGLIGDAEIRQYTCRDIQNGVATVVRVFDNEGNVIQAGDVIRLLHCISELWNDKIDWSSETPKLTRPIALRHLKITDLGDGYMLLPHVYYFDKEIDGNRKECVANFEKFNHKLKNDDDLDRLRNSLREMTGGKSLGTFRSRPIVDNNNDVEVDNNVAAAGEIIQPSGSENEYSYETEEEVVDRGTTFFTRNTMKE